jgi:hypothetical protein
LYTAGTDVNASFALEFESYSVSKQPENGEFCYTFQAGEGDGDFPAVRMPGNAQRKRCGTIQNELFGGKERD